MNDHYYSQTPTSESRPVSASFSYRGHELTLMTDAGVFSRGELDNGTRILLEALPEKLSGRILDLGCGWGPVGICVALENPDAQIVFSDINERALSLTQQNAAKYGINGTFLQSDGFTSIDGVFNCVITNPPIRTGKQVIYQMFADAQQRLTENGELYIVIRKQQGAESAKKYLQTLFPDVSVIDKSGGFWIIRCIKGGTENEV